MSVDYVMYDGSIGMKRAGYGKQKQGVVVMRIQMRARGKVITNLWVIGSIRSMARVLRVE